MNRSVQWLDVPHPFGETGNLTAAWNENTLVYGWGTNTNLISRRIIRRGGPYQSVPINLCALACRSNHDCLWRICVERRQAIEREHHAQILLDILDEVLSNESFDGWLKESDFN